VLAGLLALAVFDSVNPSAIAVTLYLLTREHAPGQVVAYVTGIFVTYLALGAAMMLGIHLLLPAWITSDSRPAWALLGIVGLGMVIYAIRAPKVPAAVAGSAVEPRARTYAGLFLLGVVVTAMELPTALPYFGAIALLTAAELPAARWLALLIVYNVIFVLPPLLLLAGHIIFGRRLDARYDELRQRLQAGARETMLWIVGLVGGGLFFWGLAEFFARSSS